MGLHNDSANDYQAFNAGLQTLADPGSGGTYNLRGIDRGLIVLTSGSRKLPNGIPRGVEVTVFATGGTVIISTVSGTVLATLTTGGAARFTSTGSNTWVSAPLTALTRNALPVAKYTSSATATSTTPAAGALTGANNVFWENTADGALEVTTRTAAQLYADSNYTAGDTYLLTIVNRGNNTVTLTGGDDVTVSGEATIATLVTRTYVVTVAGGTDIQMISVSKGTIET